MRTGPGRRTTGLRGLAGRGGKAAFVLAAVFLAALTPVPAQAADAPLFSVLAYSPADSPDPATRRGEQVLEVMERTYDLRIDITHDPSAFTADGLAGYQSVLWLGVTGQALDDAQRGALEAYVSGGGGFLAVTALSVNAEPSWDFYGELVGSRVSPFGEGDTKRDVAVDTGHNASVQDPSNVEVTDVWYEPDTDPAGLDATTVIGTFPDGDRSVPVVWAREIAGGRVFVTSMGNDYDTWGEGDFVKVVRGGLWWASGAATPIRVDTDEAAPAWPVLVSFVLWIGAIVVGGVLAVARANGREAEAR